ncbi:MAG: LamG domain-containing protein [Proteobacteria bacterium]|nr:LamG domain-containing protein [Pseudomonadota bacterium]
MNIKKGLVGYWKLSGDCKDYSGKGNHGINHGVDLAADGSVGITGSCGKFDGVSSYIEVPNTQSLCLGTGDFAVMAWVKCNDQGTDVIGNILSKYDPSRRKGITLSINASSPGYNSQGNNRLLCFGIDNAKLSELKDCGRPSEGAGFVNNYVNSLTVFDGKLYVATTHAHKKEDFGHVLRYEGGDKWVDCGRVGDLNDDGVGPMIVHNGELYAATWNYEHCERRQRVSAAWDYGHVFRYKGGKQWEDCGQPGENRRLFSFASYKGKLYVAGDGATVDPARECYMYEGGAQWKVSGRFDCLPDCLIVHDGKLWLAGGSKVYTHAGKEWEYLGRPSHLIARANPDGPVKPEFITQIHCSEVYRGQLCVGTWPKGMVTALDKEGRWKDLGCTADILQYYPKDSPLHDVEINSLVVYNGKLYAGTLPRIGLWRYESGRDWTLLMRLLPKDDKYRARLTSLTVYDGKLFISTGCSNGNIFDEPCDVRGKVFCIEAGKCISYDHDLGPGWKHIAAVKDGRTLKLYVNGQLAAKSAMFKPKEYDLSTDQPLNIGFGEVDYFSGDMREIRVHNRVITEEEVKAIFVNTKISTNG